MVFSSIDFIFIFLPIFLYVYYISNKRLRNFTVLVFSLGFYIYGSFNYPLHFFLLVASVTVNYIVALLMNNRKEKHRKMVLIGGLAYNFGMLFIFKYLGFFTGNAIELVLPIGISFYTFQAVSYLMDVYRREVPPEKSFINMAAYITMFPQLIAGPIVRYKTISDELKERTETRKEVYKGIKIFILGLGLKVLVANQLGGLWSDIGAIGIESVSTPLAWMGIYGYSFQLYFDFFGYSLMAIGLGKTIGFTFPENFHMPYMSVTMTEFWRRWHITLGSWFREYVYIPLGGNRCSKGRHYLNLFVVWILTGLWHGADWNFLLWGLSLFIITALEKRFYGEFMENHRWLGHLYMIILIPLSWLMFASENMEFAVEYMGRLVGCPGENVYAEDYIKYLGIYGKYLLAGLLLSTPLPHILHEKIKDRFILNLLVVVIFVSVVYCLYLGLNDPFLYFRF